MKLILLGTGGFLPTTTAQTACYLLAEIGLLLDAGSGLYRLADAMTKPELDIYLSHAHADHTSGLDYVFPSFFTWDVKQSMVLIHHAPLKQLDYRDELAQARRILPALKIGYDGMEIEF